MEAYLLLLLAAAGDQSNIQLDLGKEFTLKLILIKDIAKLVFNRRMALRLMVLVLTLTSMEFLVTRTDGKSMNTTWNRNRNCR